MAPAGGFSVTPGHYNAQYDYDFRQKKERVSYAEVRIISECVETFIDEVHRKGQRDKGPFTYDGHTGRVEGVAQKSDSSTVKLREWG